MQFLETEVLKELTVVALDSKETGVLVYLWLETEHAWAVK